VRAIVIAVQVQDTALLNRDEEALVATLDSASAPQFVLQFASQSQAQPPWLRFTQSPVRLKIEGERAWLTVAQWAEPLDPSKTVESNGARSVLALTKRDGAGV
ncbi:MAG: hypothetical protein LC737_07640, partial [Chloroflexi bacterium]|nr:hypothetical protein [Chloroflexota bacterium]